MCLPPAGRVLDHLAPLNGTDRYVIAAIRLFGNGQEYRERPEARNLFAIAADLAFQHCNAYLNMNELIGLFRCAGEAVRLCRDRKWWNCGCYHQLPWLSTLVQVLKDNDIPYFPLSSLSPLLDDIEKNVELGLIPRKDIEADLATLRSLCETREGSKLRASLKTLHRSSAMASSSTDQEIDIAEVMKRIHENPFPRTENDHTSPTHSRSSTLYDVTDTRLSQYSGRQSLPKSFLDSLAAAGEPTDEDRDGSFADIEMQRGSPDLYPDMQKENTADASPPVVTVASDADEAQPLEDYDLGGDTGAAENAPRTQSAHIPGFLPFAPISNRTHTVATSPLHMPHPVVADHESTDSIALVSTSYLSADAGLSTPRPRPRGSGRNIGDFTMQMPFPNIGALSPPPDPGTNLAHSRGSIGRNRQRLSMIAPDSIPEEPEGPIGVVTDPQTAGEIVEESGNDFLRADGGDPEYKSDPREGVPF